MRLRLSWVEVELSWVEVEVELSWVEVELSWVEVELRLSLSFSSQLVTTKKLNQN